MPLSHLQSPSTIHDYFLRQRADHPRNCVLAAAIVSMTNKCSICKEPYPVSKTPGLLRTCGHIFRRPCIMSHFDIGANKHPWDGKSLFLGAFVNPLNADDFDPPPATGAEQPGCAEIGASIRRSVHRPRAQVCSP